MTDLQSDQLPKSWDKPVPEPASYVQVDKYGVLRVGDIRYRISLDSVVYSFQQGDAPETIQRNFPLLTLEQVYGGIAFYLAHRDEVGEYLRRQEAIWAALKAKCDANPSPVVERLRALKRARAEQPS